MDGAKKRKRAAKRAAPVSQQPTKEKLANGYYFTRWLFIRLLTLIYAIAFASSGSQILGLVGENGIVPACRFQSLVETNYGVAVSRWIFPSLTWFNCSDAMLVFLCVGGVVLSLLALVGVATRLSLIGCWLFYLSLVTVGSVFMAFQWDALLLEVGFLSIFFAPGKLWLPVWKTIHDLRVEGRPSLLMIWLYRLLLFRFMFMSGFVKLRSGDATWANFTALNYHYETQPLPTPAAWAAHLLPEWFDKFSVLMVYVIELALPFLIFGLRRLRIFAALCEISLQIIIMLTGNYTYFNWLSIAICLCLFDDAFWSSLLKGVGKIVPGLGKTAAAIERTLEVDGVAALESGDSDPNAQEISVEEKTSSWRSTEVWQKALQAPAVIVAIIVILAGVGELCNLFNLSPPLTSDVQSLVQPLRIVNGYGLFAVMTTSRPEIVVEGSKDGDQWLPYEFRYKPGDLRRAPPIVAPHQPRLDWQMWFAALGTPQHNMWFVAFVSKLLHNEKSVLDLLQTNPFPDSPPKYVRAKLYDYHFTTWDGLMKDGQWWQRTDRGFYLPPISVQDLKSISDQGKSKEKTDQSIK